MAKKSIVITGAVGQDGLILSKLLLKKGYKVLELLKIKILKIQKELLIEILIC